MTVSRYKVLDYSVKKNQQAICVIYGECEDYRVDLNWNAISLKSVDNGQTLQRLPSGRIGVAALSKMLTALLNAFGDRVRKLR